MLYPPSPKHTDRAILWQDISSITASSHFLRRSSHWFPLLVNVQPFALATVYCLVPTLHPQLSCCQTDFSPCSSTDSLGLNISSLVIVPRGKGGV